VGKVTFFGGGDAKLWACPIEAHAKTTTGQAPMLAWVA